MNGYKVTTFNLENEEHGRLFLEDGKLVFEGDVDISAKIFFDRVAEMFNTQNQTKNKSLRVGRS